MMQRWHNGHSLATGAAFGLMLSYRPWLVFALGVICGVLAVGGFRFARTVLGGVEAWSDFAKAKAEKIRTRPEPVYAMRRQRGGPTQSDKVPF